MEVADRKYWSTPWNASRFPKFNDWVSSTNPPRLLQKLLKNNFSKNYLQNIFCDPSSLLHPWQLQPSLNEHPKYWRLEAKHEGGQHGVTEPGLRLVPDVLPGAGAVLLYVRGEVD